MKARALLLLLAVACAPQRGEREPEEDDVRAPVVSLADAPATLVTSRTARFTFGADEPAEFACRIDTGSPAPCTSPAAFEGLADGPHVFVVTATDGAGNKGEASTSWRIDATLPVARIDAGPSGTTAARTATFTIGCSEPGCAFTCALDGAPPAACSSPAHYEGLEEGPHDLQVRATDAAGNAQAEATTHAWTIAEPAPDTLLDSGPAPQTGDRIAELSFHAVPAATAFECAFDREPFASCASPIVRALDPGDHSFEVRAIDAAGPGDPSPARHAWRVFDATPIRLISANLTTGTLQRWEDAGVRILQGLAPDVALLQEFNVADPVRGTNTPDALRAFIDRAFGAGFSYAREQGVGIPNGVASRFPIVASGEWDNPIEATRDFFWARIDLPGPRDLWAVSLHLRSNGWVDPATGVSLTEKQTRQREVEALLAFLASGSPAIPPSDYLVLGGDLNADGRNEGCIVTLRSAFPDASGPFPVDQAGNGNSNASRTKPLDWVVADAELAAFAGTLRIGVNAFPQGLVLDPRTYTPLADVAPVLASDGAAAGMQHMAVMRAFYVPRD